MSTSLAMSFPVQGLTVFYNAVKFTQSIYIITEANYQADATCQEDNAGCYDATNIVSIYNPAFTVNVANPAAITLTIQAALMDTTKIGVWRVVHMIRQVIDGLQIGFQTWKFTVSALTPTWTGTLTPPTPLYLWMKNPVVMTLPTLQETQL